MTTIIIAALMGAFALAFAIRIVKWLAETIYALAPFVVLVAGLIATMMILEQYEPQENDEGSTQAVQH